MEKKDIVTLCISLLALLLTMFNLYKTFWEKPSPVISIKTQIVGFKNGVDKTIGFIFFEGLLLNKSKLPLIVKNVSLEVVHDEKWVQVPFIFLENDITIPLPGGTSYKAPPNSAMLDLSKLNCIVTLDNPQLFYAQFNLPNSVFNRLIDNESVNLRFVIVDGFGREYYYMVSTRDIGGRDLSQPVEWFPLMDKDLSKLRGF